MKALLVDVETNGLVSNALVKLDKQASVTELYMCIADLETGIVLDEIDTLVKPLKPLDEEHKSAKVTGITNEMLKDAPHFAELASGIAMILEGSIINGTPMIGHHISFDKEMLEIEFKRLGAEVQEWPRMICTVEQTAHLKGHRLTQTQLHELLFNEPFKGAHRAKADVMALLRICVELKKRELI